MSLEESQARHKAAGRNDPCPCGSGKKYKKCHYAEDEAAIHAELTKQRAAAEAVAAEEGAKAASSAATQGQRPKASQTSTKQTGNRSPSPAARAANLPRRGAV